MQADRAVAAFRRCPVEVPLSTYPVPVVDLPVAGMADVFRLTGWLLAGEVHAVRAASTVSARLLSAVRTGVCATIALVPLFTSTLWILCPLSSWTVYLSPDRTACLAVRSGRTRWTLAHHLSAHPGHGHGRALRQLLLPPLALQADAHGIPIDFTAANTRLASIYRDADPHLQRRRTPHAPGTIALRRPPQCPTAADSPRRRP